jgi:hypothetical protein
MPTPNNSSGYLGNALVKRDGVEYQFTKEEVIEYAKCMKNPVHFAENYIKVISLDKGLVSFKPYDYQRKMFEHFNDNRFSIVLACRQSGKSISSIIYILWYVCFHADKTVAILANKGATAREMLGRITLALENLPHFLQPGCKELNKGSIGFSNNSKIIASATSASSIRGLSVNLLFLDEFAFVENANEFYTSTYPVVTAGTDTKVIITSTANGVGNLYYKIYESARKEQNEFKSFRVDWWDVPGRDEKWKQQTISNTSEIQFEQEFGNNFLGTSNTLISANTILGLQHKDPIKIKDNIRYYEKPKAGHQYIMCVDVSKGRGQDYSTFNVIRITNKDFKQVCTFRDNIISPLIFPDLLMKVAKQYNDCLVVIENNDVGQVVCNAIHYEYEYENLFVESTVKASGIGVTMTKKIKRIGCSNLKDIIEMGKLEINDLNTINEISTFEVRGSSYQASDGNHDDLVMNLVLFAWFVSSEAFGNLSELDFKELLYSQTLKEIEDDLPPVGVLQDKSVGIEWYEKHKREVEDWNNL